MKKTYHSLITVSLAASILSACGGGNSQDTNSVIEQKPQPFESSMTSTLSIEEKSNDSSKTYSIKTHSTSEKDNLHAYSVSTQLANSFMHIGENNQSIRYPQLSQSFHFELEPDTLSLEISYDPIFKKANSFTLVKAASTTGDMEQKFDCRYNDLNINESCKGATLNYDALTGTANISFNQSLFTANGFSNHSFILNGKLKGTLSTPPQTIQNIPKISSGSITIDGENRQILAALNTSEKREGSEFFNTGISVLLDNATHLSFIKSKNELTSQYYDKNADFWIAYLSEKNNLTFQDLKTTSQFILKSSLFNFHTFLSAPAPKPLTISATVNAPIPQQKLILKPQPSASPSEDKNNPWYANTSFFNNSIIPDNFTIRTINHNTVMIEAQDIIAVIEDKKVKSIRLNTIIFDVDDSRSIPQLIVIDYRCGNTTLACQGVTIEPNGFGVKFNNTILTNSEVDNGSDYPLPPTITLNGGLVYLGR